MESAAMWISTHSGRLGSQIATRSPRPRPRAARAAAIARIVRQASPAAIGRPWKRSSSVSGLRSSRSSRAG